MGFNGGETSGLKDEAGDTPGARRWFRLCEEAAEAVRSPSWIVGERTHWGSPNIGELERRIGSSERFRQLLRFHAEINRDILAMYPPQVVWMTGLSAYVREAEEDYALTKVGDPAARDKRGRLWQEYRSADGVPWLATVHPTGARMSRNEFEQIKKKLGSISLMSNVAAVAHEKHSLLSRPNES